MNIMSKSWPLAVALFLGSSASHAAIGLGFGEVVLSGDSVEIPVVISGLGNGAAPSLATFDLNLLFDASHLSYSSASFGDPTLGDQLDATGAGDNPIFADTTASGVLNLYELSFDDAAALNSFQADSFTLALIHFSALSAGSSPLTISVNSLGDADGEPLTANLSPTTVVTTVPIPAAFWLMASGLGVLANIRLRANSRS